MFTGGALFAADLRRSIVRLDPDTLQPMWAAKGVFEPLALHENVLICQRFISGGDFASRAVDAESGQTLWERPGLVGTLRREILVSLWQAPDAIVVTGVQSGETVRQYRLPADTRNEGVVGDYIVCHSTARPLLQTVDIASGVRAWESGKATQLEAAIAELGPDIRIVALSDSLCVLVGRHDLVGVAVSPRGECSAAWRQRLPNMELRYAPTIVEGIACWFQDGRVVAVDAATGSVLFETGEKALSLDPVPPVAFSDCG